MSIEDIKCVHCTVPISASLLRDHPHAEVFERMLVDELSGRPWTLTVIRGRQTADERIRQIRTAIARRIAPWAMYVDEDV